MQSLHDRHRGQRCFVLGSGASLLQYDLSLLARLQNEITWGVSRLFMWKDLPFVPTYHLLSEGSSANPFLGYMWPGVAERFFVTSRKIRANGWTVVPQLPKEHYMVNEGPAGLEEEWQPLTNGRTATLNAVQLALWMGHEPIYLLGCETTLRGYAWDTWASRQQVAPVERLWKPFGVAQAAMEAKGRHLYDCTPGGKLNTENYVPYRELAEVLDAVGAVA